MKTEELNYPSYVIHVQDFKDREKSVIRQFASLNMPFEWVLDYDIPDIDQAVLDLYKYHGNKLRPADISCSLKHIVAWERICAGKQEAAFVFEDDVLIDLKRFRQLAAGAITEFYASGHEIGCISLGDGAALHVPWTKLRRGQRLYPAEQVRMTDSYWITRKTAEMRLEWLAENGFFLPADHLINKIDNELGIPILWMEPTAASQGSHTGLFSSTIQNGEGGKFLDTLEWLLKKFRRTYLLPLLGVDPRKLESALRVDLQLTDRKKISLEKR